MNKNKNSKLPQNFTATEVESVYLACFPAVLSWAVVSPTLVKREGEREVGRKGEREEKNERARKRDRVKEREKDREGE
eukprot:1380832-Amorphochlora_amoeboformis.AAC.1